MTGPVHQSEELTRLLERAAEGDAAATSALLGQYRGRLRGMIALRMDRRLASRVDASDVVQEAVIEAARRLPEYLRAPPMGFYLWLRQLALQKLIDLHRHHLGAQKRDAGRELSIDAEPGGISSEGLAQQLVGGLTSPTRAARRAELKARVQQALAELAPVDREVLMLRHFEQLSNEETASVLDVGRSAASKRYILALGRLRRLLEGVVQWEDLEG